METGWRVNRKRWSFWRSPLPGRCPVRLPRRLLLPVRTPSPSVPPWRNPKNLFDQRNQQKWRLRALIHCERPKQDDRDWRLRASSQKWVYVQTRFFQIPGKQSLGHVTWESLGKAERELWEHHFRLNEGRFQFPIPFPVQVLCALRRRPRAKGHLGASVQFFDW